MGGLFWLFLMLKYSCAKKKKKKIAVAWDFQVGVKGVKLVHDKEKVKGYQVELNQQQKTEGYEGASGGHVR